MTLPLGLLPATVLLMPPASTAEAASSAATGGLLAAMVMVVVARGLLRLPSLTVTLTTRGVGSGVVSLFANITCLSAAWKSATLAGPVSVTVISSATAVLMFGMMPPGSAPDIASTSPALALVRTTVAESSVALSTSVTVAMPAAIGMKDPVEM